MAGPMAASIRVGARAAIGRDGTVLLVGFHDPVANRHWSMLGGRFADFQLIALDPEGAVVASGRSAPLGWDGTVEGLPEGWDAALERAAAEPSRVEPPTALCALAIAVAADSQGRGVSRLVLAAMRAAAARRGFGHLIAPVRPTLKPRYPLTPLERYVRWRRPDGSPFDPWIRTHWRLGAEVLVVAPRSMVIPGSVAEWEAWAGMAFPESGSYVVPGALQPITVDRERDLGRYEEPNVWMCHHLVDRDLVDRERS